LTVAGRSQDSVLTLHQGFDERQLIAAAKELSAEAWSTIYDMHFPKVYSYIHRRLGDKATAEDLASQVFLEAFRGIGGFRYRGVSLLAWLYRIAHNVTCNHLRRRGAHGLVPLDNGHSNHEPQVPDAAERVHVWQDISRALRRLSDDQQQVLILRFIEGLPSDEVAAIMRKRVGTVRVIQNRALGRMRQLLAADSRMEE